MSRRTQKNVGVIGLGIIGQRVADSLRRRGFPVFVWNRTPRPFPNFVGSPAEIAQLCDYIQIFVSDDEALLEMVQLLKQSLKAHHIVMAHSTVAPHTMRAAAEIVHRRGAQFLDAPFTGSKIAAGKGELVYYMGGDEAAFKRARPVLEASSKEIIEIGEIGQATLIKIATNMITAATVQAAAEALALVHSSGLAPDKFVAGMQGNASNSPTLTMKLPKMIEGDFDPHFSVKHMPKDVQIASRLARSYGLTLGATETARDSLLGEAQNDRGDLDFSSLIRSFFPDGKVGNRVKAISGAEQHLTLGLEERSAESRDSEPAPEPVAKRPEELLVAEKQPEVAPAVLEVKEPEAAAIEPQSDQEVTEPVSEKIEEAEPELIKDLLPNESPAVAVDQGETHKKEIAKPRPRPRPVAPAPVDDEERRGFFRRMFGKGLDY